MPPRDPDKAVSTWEDRLQSCLPRETPVASDKFIDDEELKKQLRSTTNIKVIPKAVQRGLLVDWAVRLNIFTKDQCSVPPPETKKRERPDRLEKLKQRKGNVETVIKCCLRKHIACTDSTDSLVSAIQDRVSAYSQRVHSASLGLHHIIKQLFDDVEDKDIHGVQLPQFTSQTFLRQLLTGTAQDETVEPIVRTLHQEHPEYLAATPRYQGDRNIYSAGARMMSTNIKNHLRLNLLSKLKKLLYAMPWSKPECTAAFLRTAGYPQRSEPVVTLPAPAGRLVNKLREVLGLPATGVISKVWLNDDQNLGGILRCFIYLNRRLRDFGLPLFNILPVSSIRAHYITIDKSVLYGLMKEQELVAGNEATFNTLVDDHWQSTFHIQKLLSASNKCQFTGTIDTDGISLCIHQRRPRTTIDVARKMVDVTDPKIDIQPNDLVVGVDPGGCDIMHVAVPVRKPGLKRSFQSLNLSRVQYYTEAGILCARKHSEQWNSGIRRTLDALTGVSTKGDRLSDLTAFMAVHQQHQATLWDEYMKPRWARQRLRLYGGKKRVFAKFFNKLSAMAPDSCRIVVAYGSAKFAPGAVGRPAVPTTRAYKECSYRFATVPVCEFRTTAVHHSTGQLLQKVSSRDTGKTVRGLLWCGSTNQTIGKFVNRDLNAAINIRRCLVLEERPVELQRRVGLEPIRWTVGRVLRR